MGDIIGPPVVGELEGAAEADGGAVGLCVEVGKFVGGCNGLTIGARDEEGLQLGG